MYSKMLQQLSPSMGIKSECSPVYFSTFAEKFCDVYVLYLKPEKKNNQCFAVKEGNPSNHNTTNEKSTQKLEKG